MDLPNYDNFQKWLNYFKYKRIFKVWLVSPIFFLGIIVSLLILNNGLRGDIAKLKDDIAPIRELYPKLELSAAVAKLMEDYKVLNNAVLDEKWRRAARLSMSCTEGAFCTGEDSACGLMSSSVKFLEGGQITFECNESASEKWLGAIKAEPTCPFPYAFLAYCYKKQGNVTWREYAINARDILEKTSKIAGHKGEHNDLLQKVNDLLIEKANTP